jgi:hypothetical protein
MANIPPPSTRAEPNWRYLFPELGTWIDSAPQHNLNGSELAIGMTRADSALALAEFYWPSFVVIDDMVLRAYADDLSLRERLTYWSESMKGNKSATESMINHEHFWHLVQSSPPTVEAVMQWGALVREMWVAKLARDFADRQFEVELHTGPNVELMDHQITFWQKR